MSFPLILLQERLEKKKMRPKIYIDGSAGTTGLRINERFQGREDIEILSIPEELRKDPETRKEFINRSDITFLCLPDAASIEAVSMIENDNVRIIDTSTAHRTTAGWAYGFPELSPEFRNAIRTGKRIANPGCHASGFIAVTYPLVAKGILPKDYPVTSYSLTGYSGGGKKMIAEYEGEDRNKELDSPRMYALTQQHKHLKEMQQITKLNDLPLFTPIVADYYSGMVVTLPLYTKLLNGSQTAKSIQEFFSDYYKDEPFIQVLPYGCEEKLHGFLGSNNCSGWDGMQICVTGNDDRVMISSRFDNLGKGASGAAIQCMNIMLGCDETTGLSL